MRLICVAVALACAACSSGTGPSQPPDSIAGRWSNWAPGQAATPGGPEIFTLTESGTAVSGSEAWSVQTHNVSGQYVRPNITLSVSTLAIHQIVIDTGRALDANRIRLGDTIFYRQ